MGAPSPAVRLAAEAVISEGFNIAFFLRGILSAKRELIDLILELEVWAGGWGGGGDWEEKMEDSEW